jgi:hypothetical protein
VTVEREFGALKNRFRIINNKYFHPYKTQVKLVLACRILHNWILEHGTDEVIPHESSWVPTVVLLMGMVLPWMTILHGLHLGMNGLIKYGLIGVTLISRTM